MGFEAAVSHPADSIPAIAEACGRFAVECSDVAGYVASASISHPEDLIAKFRKAAARDGFAYIHILAPCYRGWDIPADASVSTARRAVECGLWELFELEDGKRRRTVEPSFIPVADYLMPQGRFRKLSVEQIEKVQEDVNRYYGRRGGDR